MMKARIWFLGIVLSIGMSFAAAGARAHGGEEHVIGTVIKVSDTSVTVKTTTGKVVEVGFDAKTTYARTKLPAQKADVKVGDRIVIHAVEVNEKLFAHTVELGAATAAK